MWFFFFLSTENIIYFLFLEIGVMAFFFFFAWIDNAFLLLIKKNFLKTLSIQCPNIYIQQKNEIVNEETKFLQDIFFLFWRLMYFRSSFFLSFLFDKLLLLFCKSILNFWFFFFSRNLIFLFILVLNLKFLNLCLKN